MYGTPPATTGRFIAGFVALLILAPVFVSHGDPDPAPPPSWCDNTGATTDTPGC